MLIPTSFVPALKLWLSCSGRCLVAVRTKSVAGGASICVPTAIDGIKPEKSCLPRKIRGKHDPELTTEIKNEGNSTVRVTCLCSFYIFEGFKFGSGAHWCGTPSGQ